LQRPLRRSARRSPFGRLAEPRIVALRRDVVDRRAGRRRAGIAGALRRGGGCREQGGNAVERRSYGDARERGAHARRERRASQYGPADDRADLGDGTARQSSKRFAVNPPV